jgi:tetratricopeptide (TPR) repeat protein
MGSKSPRKAWLHLFFQGDIYRTQELMREAFYSAESLGDLGAQIWYATVIGNGLGELGLPDQALKFLDEALRSAEGNKDAGFPFFAYAGKARSLAELKNRSEAKKMLEKGLREAQSFNRRLDDRIVNGRCRKPELMVSNSSRRKLQVDYRQLMAEAPN